MTAAVGTSGVDGRLIGLAGIFQAAALVRAAAREGLMDQSSFESSIASTLRLDAPSPEMVFGGIRGLRLGLSTLWAQLGPGREQRDVEITRYAVNLMFLERKLASEPAMLERIRAGVEAATAQAEGRTVTDESVIGMLAALYTETLSRLSPRIMVAGERTLLDDADNANRIRALLLAGLRSAVLWRQMGGNRFRLLLERSRLTQRARELEQGCAE